jgi:hypothetical protein
MTKEEAVSLDAMRDINDIYEVMLKQSSQNSTLSKHKASKFSYNEKVLEVKGYLNLQGQVGSLKQFKYDVDFSKLMDLHKYQTILNKFSLEHGLNASEILYLKNISF